MPIELGSSNFYYLSKPANYVNKNDTKLIIKALGNKSPEKINQLIQDNRFIQVENKDNQLTVKADAQIAEFLASRNFSSVEIKHVSGEREVIQSKINIKTLTTSESNELNRAVDSFLTSVVLARQEQANEESESKSDKSKDTFAASKFKSQEGSPLRPSDYLKKSALASFKSGTGYLENLKAEEKKAEDHAKLQEEKSDMRKRDIIKTENKKWDNKQDGIKKST